MKRRRDIVFLSFRGVEEERGTYGVYLEKMEVITLKPLNKIRYRYIIIFGEEVDIVYFSIIRY